MFGGENEYNSCHYGRRKESAWLGVGQIKAWLQHAIDNKIRQRTDASVLEHTDRNPKKLSKEDKLILLKNVTLPTKEERGQIL